MRKFHISISTQDYDRSVADYTKRLGAPPVVVSDGRYALWRTEILNLSVSCKIGQPGGQVRHLGFEDDGETAFREEKDVNGIAWEYFSEADQRAEIDHHFPDAEHRRGKIG